LTGSIPTPCDGQGIYLESWTSLGSLSSEEVKRRTFLFPAHPDEKWSNRRYGPMELPRFHYRYEAAELAWQAAELLPCNDERAATILTTAGKWLAGRDAPAADRFYQALESRHGETTLGREAQVRRWFPDFAIDYNDTVSTFV